jgi:hypothetical protein
MDHLAQLPENSAGSGTHIYFVAEMVEPDITDFDDGLKVKSSKD